MEYEQSKKKLIMVIHAFCDEQFLIQLSEASTIDLVEDDKFHEQIAKVKLFDLLRNGVKINCYIKNIDEINPFIKSLIRKGSSSRLGEKEVLALKENPTEFITRKGINNSLFLLADAQTNNLKRLEDSFGYHCLDFKNYSSIFKESIQLFKRNSERTDWKIAREYLQPHNSLLIVDPYLFTTSGFTPFLEFLRAILPAKLQSKYHLSLIANKYIAEHNSININEAKEKLINLLSTSLKAFSLEIHLFNKVPVGNPNNLPHASPEDFHDRYLISNNACIFSGRGLDYIKTYQMKYEGTWLIFKPFSKITLEKEGAFFTKVIEKKIKGFKKWIEQSDYNISQNPLVTCYKD